MVKIILGAAQLKSRYGINEDYTSTKEFIKILRICKKNNIKKIDTALDYNKLGSQLTKSYLKNFSIISKIKFKQKNNFKKCESNIIESLNNLDKKSYYAILHHNISKFSNKDIKSHIDFLNFLKKKKYTKKVGISVYNSKDLKKINDFKKIDIIQFPLNIFDTDVIDYINLKKIKNIELHARSILLQGVLVNDFKKNKKIFNSNQKILQEWENWSKNNNISKLQACLNFVLSIKKLDYIVIGFNRSEQLKEFLNFKNKASNIYPSIFKNKNKKIIDPRKWKKNENLL